MSNAVAVSPLSAVLDETLRIALGAGLALVLLIPAARGMHGLLGWVPLWLVAMPAVALWALHGFSMPATRRGPRPAMRHVRAPMQARRRRGRATTWARVA